MAKYLQFGLILLACVVLDQWTKQIASSRLATTHYGFTHALEFEVAPELAGKTVEEVLAHEFGSNSAEEVGAIARRFVETPDGERLRANQVLQAGERLRVTYRKVTVVPDYFELEYTRNPGAAFGLLSRANSPWRIPFFIAVSVIAIVVILVMLRGVDRSQQLTIWALSLIAGGAIGNFVDRLLYGWVIDFIVWKYTDEYRWPTFNVADAFISTGVGLLVLDMILDGIRKRRAPTANAGAVTDVHSDSAREEE